MTREQITRHAGRRVWRHRAATLATTAIAAAFSLVGAESAVAAFGIAPETLDGSVLDAEGKTYTQASGHPYSAGVDFDLNRVSAPGGFGEQSDESDVRHIVTEVPAGLVGNPNATPTCSREVFLSIDNPVPGLCPANTQVGVASIDISVFGNIGQIPAPVYNLEPPRGAPAQFGFAPFGVITFATPYLRSTGPNADYGFTFHVEDIPQAGSIIGASLRFWGVPAASAHDSERGDFGFEKLGFPIMCSGDPLVFGPPIGPPCSSNSPRIPFLTSPANCSHGAFDTEVIVSAWQGQTDSDVFTSHDDEGNPIGVENCDRVPFDPEIALTPTSDSAETPSGLEVQLAMPTLGLRNPDGIAQSPLKKATVALPEGVTLNPSSAEGLSTCSPEQFESETETSQEGDGCPNGSRLGSVSIASPLMPNGELLHGSLYLAEQDDPETDARGAENPFDSLIALYIVARNRERGVMVKLPGKVEPDERTGRIVTTFDDLPQLPFSTFHLKFREGGRAPLVTPPACGTYTTEAEFVPWSAQDPDDPRPGEIVETESKFKVTRGVGGGSCPEGDVPPFEPDFTAGSLNNNAGSYTPFSMRLSRSDGEQDMTKFSAELPAGVLAKIAGVERCPEAAIAAAKSKRGREEKDDPSCPASSEIGRTLAGSGVGSVLTYVPGKLYLAGPFGGAPLSVVAVTPAVAGPFDVGTVVVREALTLDRKNAQVRVDGSLSDPIPHILEGIPLKLRDLRVYVDRSDFIVNPTSCNPSQVKATLFGANADVFSSADDVPVGLASRFQAASCQQLRFGPRLKLRLRGGTRRGAYPGLRAVLNARPGDANIRRAVVTLPRSAFLEQAHIRTICTRVQWAADRCPKGARYGYARAWSPLLDFPLQGPVYLRSSNNRLPDMVADLRGPVHTPVRIELVGRIDSVRLGRGDFGIRATFAGVPDAPVNRFVLRMQGGKKGLIVNSRNLCRGKHRARARFKGQNGVRHNFRPVVRPSCKRRKARRSSHARVNLAGASAVR